MQTTDIANSVVLGHPCPPPDAIIDPLGSIVKSEMCSCSGGDDNPYPPEDHDDD